jgi:hypothetical protein
MNEPEPQDRTGELLGELLANQMVLYALIKACAEPAILLERLPGIREAAIAIVLGQAGPDEAQAGVERGFLSIEKIIHKFHPGT